MSKKSFVEAAAAIPVDKHQGYVERPLVNTAPRLIVFSAQEFAWSAGFRGPGMTHHQAPWLFGWALGANVDPLRSREWSEVIITEAAGRLASQGGGAYREYLERAVYILRGLLRLEPMLWIEL